MNDQETVETLQVTAVPGDPNAEATTEHAVSAPTGDPGTTDLETATPGTETTPTDGGGTEESQLSDAQAAELEAMASEADQLSQGGGADITPATSQNEEQTQGGGEGEWTDTQKLNYLVNTMHDLEQRVRVQEQGGAQPQTSENAGANAGAADIYNGAFEDTQESAQPNPNDPNEQRFQRLETRLEELVTVSKGLHTAHNNLQATLSQQAAQQEEQTEIQAIQVEHKLSDEDAQRVYLFMKDGQFSKAMRFARGRSQVENATAEMLQQRHDDRELSGRPAVPGGTSAAPTPTNANLKAKFDEYSAMPDGTQKDALAEWLVQNGGMEYIAQEATSLAQQGIASMPADENQPHSIL